ncbi:MAG: CCA tRNA nucleotidyltransferase [Actinobacteria bacterium]|nr:CCA tRNA nucleotidyltransferase [Actinomycetota bacterium]
MIPERLEFLQSPDLPPAQLIELFSDAGEQLYLVGGSVRDAFLERPVEDFDFATSARPERVAHILERWADVVYEVGAAFGTIAARKDGRTVEITTFRDEVYRDDTRKPQVTFSDDIETDLSRRDFTANAIALTLPSLDAVDPYDGLVDLAARTLRTPLHPEVSFGDDPLRMLRLFRFQATLGFDPDSTAVAAVEAMGQRLEIVSAERIRDELTKLLLAPAPGDALRSLVASGLAERFIPELPGLAMEQDPNQRHKDVLEHTFAVVDKTTPDLVLRLAALLHDVGKPDTREFGPDGVSFHHHEVVGARMARKRLRALRYPKEVVEDVAELVHLHLRPHTLKLGWSDSAVRRYVRDAGALLGRLNELVRSDVTTASPRREGAIQRRIDELEERIAELSEREELDRMRPPIDGHQVMDYLGIGPGPRVGEVLELLLERRIEEGPYPPAAAYAMAREWAIEAGLPDPGPPPGTEEE